MHSGLANEGWPESETGTKDASRRKGTRQTRLGQRWNLAASCMVAWKEQRSDKPLCIALSGLSQGCCPCSRSLAYVVRLVPITQIPTSSMISFRHAMVVFMIPIYFRILVRNRLPLYSQHNESSSKHHDSAVSHLLFEPGWAAASMA